MDSLKRHDVERTPGPHDTTDIRVALRSRRPAPSQLHTAWGQYLKGFEWDWVAELTPRHADYSADRLQREFVDGFVRRLAWHARDAVPWFAATERGAGGVMHIHALLAAKHISIDGIRACGKVGISEVTEYDEAGDMSFYITKTLALPKVSDERGNSSRTMPPLRAAWDEEVLGHGRGVAEVENC